MNLKSGCMFWPQVYPGQEQQFPMLESDIECDVAIVGGGITGALVAYYLVQEGIHCVMVDRLRVGHGSTAASTGLLLYEIDTPLIELAGKIGKDRAIAAYRASLESVRAFEPLVESLGDDCGLAARPSLYLASHAKDVEALHAEYEARRSIQIDVAFLGREPLRDAFNVNRPAAIRSRPALEVDPYHLTLQLIRRAAEKGLEVFNDTQIASLSTTEPGMILTASNGARLTAKKVVFATGYETVQQLPPALCRLKSTFALVSEPLASFTEWPQRCLIWESARPYLYLRTTQDDRAIVGGADEDIVDPRRRDALLEKKARELCEKFSELFPGIPIETSCAWTGTFAESRDGLPYIGVLPQFPHSYFALGYGGNGITFSLLAAQILRDLFLGKATERMRLFAFDR